MKNLSDKTVGIIHANALTIDAMKPYIKKFIPDVEIMHVCDDTIQRDNILAGVGVIPKVNYFKFGSSWVINKHNLLKTPRVKAGPLLIFKNFKFYKKRR
jgi:hypothetical protein